jgi:hypothetical protein
MVSAHPCTVQTAVAADLIAARLRVLWIYATNTENQHMTTPYSQRLESAATPTLNASLLQLQHHNSSMLMQQRAATAAHEAFTQYSASLFSPKPKTLTGKRAGV